MIKGIVAVAKNSAIGKDGKLPWHYPADLRFFKEATIGNSVVMGSNTWRSLGKPLPNRLNIVLSHDAVKEAHPDVVHLMSVTEILKFASSLGGDLFIIGGAKTYESFAAYIETWIVTEIPIEVEDGDTFMPTNFLDGFSLAETVDLGNGVNVRTFIRQTVLV